MCIFCTETIKIPVTMQMDWSLSLHYLIYLNKSIVITLPFRRIEKSLEVFTLHIITKSRKKKSSKLKYTIIVHNIQRNACKFPSDNLNQSGSRGLPLKDIRPNMRTWWWKKCWSPSVVASAIKPKPLNIKGEKFASVRLYNNRTHNCHLSYIT